MDTNASEETKKAVGEIIHAAYNYKPMSKELETKLKELRDIMMMAADGDDLTLINECIALASQQPPAGQVTDLLSRVRGAIHAGPVTNTGTRAGHVESLVIFGMVDQIDAALASAPRGAGRWIPVSERCPKLKPCDPVFDKSDRVAVIANGMTDVSRYKRWRDDGLLEWSIPGVTHWMELPPVPPTK